MDFIYESYDDFVMQILSTVNSWLSTECVGYVRMESMCLSLVNDRCCKHPDSRSHYAIRATLLIHQVIQFSLLQNRMTKS